ncbi:MAG TPA: sugar ABC transporter permease [Aggregatilineales bacterium]|nr:sugar ABC transporter permease [Aggregatilineales bacterium]
MTARLAPPITAIRKYYLGYLFIAVPVASSIIFLLIPMLTSLIWSFTDFNGLQPPHFVGLGNYVELFTRDKLFIKALQNTAIFVVLSLGAGPVLGLLTALMLNQNVRLRALFRTAYFLPVMTSMVVVATLWRMLYNESGLFNTILSSLGLGTVGWLSDPNWALVSVVIASVWQGFGYETVIFLSALQTIPGELYEAATIDGAGALAKFRFITLPSLRSVILFIYVIGIIGGAQVFDQVFVMTQGGPVNSTTTIVFYLYRRFQDLRLGYASAIAYILFLILVGFSFVQWRVLGERD